MRVVNEEGGALSATITRILVVDDFEPWRRFISSGVSNHPNLQIVAEASDGLEALQKAEQLQPDLILLDIGLPALNGIEAARRIRRLSPKSKILFVSEHRSIDIAREAIRAGGSGYLVKSSAGNELGPAMAAVLEGKPFASASLGAQPFIDTVTDDHSSPQDVPGTLSTNNVEVSRDHQVVFYPNDESCMDGFARFAKSAADAGNPVVVVATKSHRAGILKRLKEGLDVDAAMEQGSLIVADVDEVLAAFMKEDTPVAARVNAIARKLIAKAAKAAPTEHSRIAVCGELAPTLLARGKTEAAILVERLFDDIVIAHNLDLLCGYVLGAYPSGQHSRIVERICAEHSAVHMQ
jgi:DNA-binding NarL/FixJ family response regulator